MNDADFFEPISPFTVDFSAIRRIRSSKESDVLELAKIAGLDIRSDFRHSDLRGIEWGGLDVSAVNLEGSVCGEPSTEAVRIGDIVYLESTGLGKVVSKHLENVDQRCEPVIEIMHSNYEEGDSRFSRITNEDILLRVGSSGNDLATPDDIFEILKRHVEIGKKAAIHDEYTYNGNFDHPLASLKTEQDFRDRIVKQYSFDVSNLDFSHWALSVGYIDRIVFAIKFTEKRLAAIKIVRDDLAGRISEVIALEIGLTLDQADRAGSSVIHGIIDRQIHWP